MKHVSRGAEMAAAFAQAKRAMIESAKKGERPVRAEVQVFEEDVAGVKTDVKLVIVARGAGEG